MNKTQEQELIDAFFEKECDRSGVYGNDAELIADWWIDKIKQRDEKIVEDINNLKRPKIQVPIPCPDADGGMIVCAVYHFKEIEPKENEVVDKALEIFKKHTFSS